MTERVECSCGRPRATAADLDRWFDEVPNSFGRIDSWPKTVAVARSLTGLSSAGHGDSDLAAAGREPDWARALCWTTIGARCKMRRRWASDRHIREARLAMLDFVKRATGASVGVLYDDGRIDIVTDGDVLQSSGEVFDSGAIN